MHVRGSDRRYLSLVAILGSILGCTNAADLGARDGGHDPGTGGGNYTARVVAACEGAPSHRLNWVNDPTGDAPKLPAPAGNCADRAKCLDSSSLDPAVAAKSAECLEQDTEKDKSTCSENDVRNVSATRPAVTAAENACAKKKAECPDLSSGCGGGYGYGTASDGVLQNVLGCFDKPCEYIADCVDAAVDVSADCIDKLFH